MSCNNLNCVKTISRYLNYATLAYQCRLRYILSNDIIEEIEANYIDADNKVQALLIKIIQLKKGRELTEILFNVIDELLYTIPTIPLK